jgi:hypothetical protein
MRYFVLDDDHALIEVDESNLTAWKLWMRRNVPQRFVGRMEIHEEYLVSTIFMGQDESEQPNPFVTAVFAKGHASPVYTCRWPDWEAAEDGHFKVVVRTFTRWVIEREHGGYPISQ